jgi:hypothetical protein
MRPLREPAVDHGCNLKEASAMAKGSWRRQIDFVNIYEMK